MLHQLVENCERLSPRRIEAAKRSFTTRRVSFAEDAYLIRHKAPTSGDLMLAEVLSVGHHQFLENPHGRRCGLLPGDKVIVCYGARYAPDQFEGIVPPNLEPCHLLAGGGIAGQVVSRHTKARAPTCLKPVGLIGDRHGAVWNVRDFRLKEAKAPKKLPLTIAVVGTSMNAGKTLAASSLIRGLSLAGLKVGAAKLTGTGSGGDVWSMADHGATGVLDFTDAGFATTQGAEPNELKEGVLLMLNHLSNGENDAIVFEIADGLFQRETALLLESPEIRDRIHRIVFAASESMGAVAGVDWLRERDLPVIALAGVMTASPLASAEAEAATGLATYTTQKLRDPELAGKLCFSADEGVREKLRICA